jgi:hypothetical protein
VPLLSRSSLTTDACSQKSLRTLRWIELERWRSLIASIANLRISNRYRLVSSHPMLREGDSIVFTALSIPVQNKDDFSCPNEHIEVLRQKCPTSSSPTCLAARSRYDFKDCAKTFAPVGGQCFTGRVQRRWPDRCGLLHRRRCLAGRSFDWERLVGP